MNAAAPDHTPFAAMLLATPEFRCLHDRVMAAVEGCSAYMANEGRVETGLVAPEARDDHARAVIAVTGGFMSLAAVAAVLAGAGDGRIDMNRCVNELSRTHVMDFIDNGAGNDGNTAAGLAEQAAVCDGLRRELARYVRQAVPAREGIRPGPGPARELMQALEEGLRGA